MWVLVYHKTYFQPNLDVMLNYHLAYVNDPEVMIAHSLLIYEIMQVKAISFTLKQATILDYIWTWEV